jgi:hypothetical protein
MLLGSALHHPHIATLWVIMALPGPQWLPYLLPSLDALLLLIVTSAHKWGSVSVHISISLARCYCLLGD